MRIHRASCVIGPPGSPPARVFGMEPLRRVDAGVYETVDSVYVIRHIARHVWELRMLTGIVATCDTKLSCECVLARHRAFHSGAIDRAEYESEIEQWTR